jgi:hypothetical protein
MNVFTALLLSSTMLACTQAQDALTLDKTIPMQKVEGRIDHLAADVTGQRLFVAALGKNTVEAC